MQNFDQPEEDIDDASRSFLFTRISFGLVAAFYLVNIAQYASPHNWLYPHATTDLVSLFVLQGMLGACIGATARPTFFGREYEMYSTLPHATLGSWLGTTTSVAVLALAHYKNNTVLTLATAALIINFAVIALVAYHERRLVRDTPRPVP